MGGVDKRSDSQVGKEGKRRRGLFQPVQGKRKDGQKKIPRRGMKRKNMRIGGKKNKPLIQNGYKDNVQESEVKSYKESIREGIVIGGGQWRKSLIK